MVVIVFSLVIVEEYQVRLKRPSSPSAKWYQDSQQATGRVGGEGEGGITIRETSK